MTFSNLLRVALVGTSLAFTSSLAHASEVSLTVAGIGPKRGEIRAALCTQAEFTVFDCRYSERVPARSRSAMLRFKDVIDGTYAVIVFHDLFGDGRVHRSLFGIPKQGVGFSRNPSLLRKPTFAETSFALQTDTTLQVKLRFEPAG